MSFDVRAHDTIRAAILADWRTRYQLRGYDLDVSKDSDAYAWADAIAFQVEGLEGRAQQLTRELFPDTATTAFLERHAAVIGFARKPATQATLTLAITGTGSWTTSDRLVSSSGAQYAPTTSGSIAGSGSVTVQSLTAGTTGNLGVDSSLTWSPAPSGIDADATVSATGVVAVDIESDSALAQRILAYWRERPGGGNRADWREWAESISGVDAAFIYRALHPSLGPGTPGAVTVCVMQPMPTATNAQGEPLAANSRVAAGDVLTAIETYLFTTDGGKCPATVNPDDVDVVSVSEQPQDIDTEITPSAGYSFPWASGPLAYTGGTATTVSVASLPAGITSGMSVYVAVPDNAVRGLYAYRTAVISGAGPYTFTFAAVGAGSATGSLLPLPSNAPNIRAALLAVFDALGPGESVSPSLRWPAVDGTLYPRTLFRSSLIAALQGVPGLALSGVDGVTNAVIDLVGAVNPELVQPPAKTIMKCGALRILSP